MAALKTICLAAVLGVVAHGAPAANPLLITTDMDIDDMEAIMYLLAKNTEIAAISADKNGWSNQFSGVTNIQRMLQAAGCPRGQVSVAYGETSYTILSGGVNGSAFNGGHYLDLPPQLFLDGINNVFIGCPVEGSVVLPVQPVAPYPLQGHAMVVNAFKEYGKLDVLILGTSTTLARAIEADRSILSMMGTITYSGGFLLDLDATTVTPEDIDTTKEGFYKGCLPPCDVFDDTEVAGWNFFLDANAAASIFSSVQACRDEGMSSCPTIKLMSIQAQQGYLSYSCPAEIAEYCDPCDEGFSKIVKDFGSTMAECTGQTYKDLSYWDQSAAVVADGDDSFCTDWQTIKIMVSLVNGPTWSKLIYDDELGVEVEFCAEADRDAFMTEFWGTFSAEYELTCPSSPVPIMPGGGGCADDPDWHKKGNPSKDCAWVAKLPDPRCMVKSEDKTKAMDACKCACPEE